MLVKKEESVRFENSPACIAFEYPLQDKDINIALIEINGRYPKTGRVSNQEVKEIVFVVGGEGKIVIEKKEYGLKEKSAVLIQPKKRYFFQGKLELLVACNPAWTEKQHKMIQK